MKLTSFTFCLYILINWNLSGQDLPACDPDTSFISSGAIADPSPFVNDTLGDNLPAGCLNSEYDVTIFLNPPTSINISGFALNIASFKIDSVINLPSGLTFECSRENCLFPAGEISCIRVFGTPDQNNSDTIYEPSIHLTVNTSLFPIEVSFPDPALAPGSYFITLHPENDPACQTVNTLDLTKAMEFKTVFPNPASDQIHLGVDQKLTAESELQIYDQTGRLVKIQKGFPANGLFQATVFDLDPGFYIVRMLAGEQVYRSKFLKN